MTKGFREWVEAIKELQIFEKSDDTIELTSDKTLCCSLGCPRRDACGRANINNIGTFIVEDYFSFGSGVFTNAENKIEHWCGPWGNWKMWEEIKE